LQQYVPGAGDKYMLVRGPHVKRPGLHGALWPVPLRTLHGVETLYGWSLENNRPKLCKQWLIQALMAPCRGCISKLAAAQSSFGFSSSSAAVLAKRVQPTCCSPDQLTVPSVLRAQSNHCDAAHLLDACHMSYLQQFDCRPAVF
jgi:hypothetical protein